MATLIVLSASIVGVVDSLALDTSGNGHQRAMCPARFNVWGWT
jgi:hypothetical protein